MVRLLRSAGLGLLVATGCMVSGSGATSTTVASRARAAGAENGPVCVRWWQESRYRNYGYDHLVHISNGCSVTAACAVTTDVAPSPISVRVEPRETQSVLTYRGAPAREFRADVRCALET